MMNGYNGWQGDGYGFDGGMSYGHPFTGGEAMVFLMPVLFFCFVIALAMVVFQIWLYFRIFAKAGYNGWWSMLALIPGVGMLVVMLVLAFDNWPIHRGLSGGSPMTGPAPVTPASNIGVHASAYNPVQSTAHVTPVPVSYAAPVVPTAPVASAAPAEPAVPAPAEPVAGEAPKVGSAE